LLTRQGWAAKQSVFLAAVFALSLIAAPCFAQIFSASLVAPSSLPMELDVEINAGTNVVTITMRGPADRWFGFGFNTNTMQGYAIVTELSGGHTTHERNLVAVGDPGVPHTTQDLNLVSSTITGSTIERVFTRPLITAEGYNFENYQLGNPINLIWAFSSFGNPTLAWHGASGRGKDVTVQFAEEPTPVQPRSWGLMKLEFKEITQEK
ncbi:MAG: hypothetical protein HKN21_17155, partial [Candidatus Eisenbacteria bacterium]|nr:hypothetical protein [Candidatus Eisenbacteria bacterium]